MNGDPWRRAQWREPVGPGVSIGFAGDTLFGYPPDQACVVDDAVLTAVGTCDAFIVNQEGALTDAPPQARRGVVLAAPPTSAEHLKRLGATAACLANNHIMDHGSDGLRETLAVLADHEVAAFGAGMSIREAARPLRIEHGGLAISVLAYSTAEGVQPLADDARPGAMPLDVEQARAAIREERSTGRIVVAVYHGGSEFFRMPDPSRRRLFHALADAGAHAVIGHHPHMFQGIERRGACTLAYSLGNFHLRRREYGFVSGTEYGLVVALECDARGVFGTRLLFTMVSDADGRLQVARDESDERCWRLLTAMSDMLGDDDRYRRAYCYECARVVTGTSSSRQRRSGWWAHALRPAAVLYSHMRRAARSARHREILFSALRGAWQLPSPRHPMHDWFK